MNTRETREHVLSKMMEGKHGWEIEWRDWVKHPSKMIQVAMWCASKDKRYIQVLAYWMDHETPPEALKISTRIYLEEIIDEY